MPSHKEGCQWDDFYLNVYANNPYGADESITIVSDYLSYTDNATNPIAAKESVHINFNYCPCCGCSLNGEEEVVDRFVELVEYENSYESYK